MIDFLKAGGKQDPSAKTTTLGYINWGLIIIPFLYVAIAGINAPLWWDELNSFVYYTLFDTEHTLTSLRTANNHIFFNYVMNIFSEKISTRDMDEIITAPYKFRIITFISSLLTIFFTYKTGRRISGKAAGMIAAITLITTIPYINYCLQLRGYSFSMLFLSTSLYFIFSYQETGKIRDMLMIPLSIFLLLFTILSNVYATACIGLIVFIQLLIQRLKKNKPDAVNDKGTEPAENIQKLSARKARHVAKKPVNKGAAFRPPYFKSLIFFGIGVVIAILRYIPVWEDFLFLNKAQLSAPPPYRSFVMAELLPAVFMHFISFRYLIFLILGIGIWLGFYRDNRSRFGKTFLFSLFFLILFLTPFLLSFISNNNPFDRTFVVLIPAFALLVGLLTDMIMSKFNFLNTRKESVLTFFILYSLVTFFIAESHIQKKLKDDILNGVKNHELTYNYYLSDHFKPIEEMSDFINFQNTDRRLPIISFNDVDMISLSTAANLNNMTYIKMNWEKPTDTSYAADGRIVINNMADYWQSTKQSNLGYTVWQLKYPSNPNDKDMGMKTLIQYLIQNKIITNRFYAVTGFPNKFREDLKAVFPNATAKPLFKKYSYNNFYEVVLK